jgi:hypothetical protein
MAGLKHKQTHKKRPIFIGSFEPTLYPSYISLDNTLKGIVQRDLTGVETRLKRSALMNQVVAKFSL